MKDGGIDATSKATLSMRTLQFYAQLIAWPGVIALTFWAWRTPPVADEPNWQDLGVDRSEGWVYRTIGSRRMTLDVYRPSRSSDLSRPEVPRPAVLAIHGGSWNGGSTNAFRYDPRNVVTRLAQRGLVVFALEYRLARPGEPSWPGVVDDLREAVRWLRRHSAEFGVDPGRIAVMGQSSGGHLAALLATLPEEAGPGGASSRVQAVVCFYSPFDLPALMSFRRLAHEPARALVGDARPGTMDHAAEASPIEHVTADDPPVLMIHGSDDAWVPWDQSARMADALDRAGVPHRLIVINGARHGFGTRLTEPVRRDLVPEILAFLESAWKGPPM